MISVDLEGQRSWSLTNVGCAEMLRFALPLFDLVMITLLFLKFTLKVLSFMPVPCRSYNKMNILSF